MCSTWVVMERGSTKRSENNVLGQTKHPSVKHANLMVARSALLMALAMLRLMCFMLEQPHSSLMALHPLMQLVARVATTLPAGKWVEVSTYMGAYGGDRPKRSKLYGNRAWMKNFQRELDGNKIPSCSEVGVSENMPNGKCKGGEHLKATQEYPDLFAAEVYVQWKAHEPRTTNAVEKMTPERLLVKIIPLGRRDLPQWENMAELGAVLQYLKDQQ